MQSNPRVYPLFRMRKTNPVHLRTGLMLILFLSNFLIVSGSDHYFRKKVDFPDKDTLLLKEVLKDFEKATPFVFVCDANLLKTFVSIFDVSSGEKIENVLDRTLSGTDIMYKINEMQVFLYSKDKAENQVSEKISSQQQRIISGTVVGSDKSPLIGVTVLVKGTAAGALTDLNGKYSIVMPENSQILVFSFIGLETQEIPIGTSNVYNVTLVESNLVLDEVVVVGYGVQKKESVVGAITQVNNASIMKSGTTNITNAIAGKLSGVLTIQQSGEPGNNASEIIVRGLSSWNSSKPLVLVDGVERDFSDLDPNEINTVSVLKDASATAVFGAKGANGVIIVNTKRGSVGKTSFEVSTSYGLQKATRLPDHISSYTTASLMNVAKMNDQLFTDLFSQDVLDEYYQPSSRLNSIRYPDVNWFEETTNKFASTYDANINIKGGTKFVKYFISTGYVYEGSFFKGYEDGFQNTSYNYSRYNYRANLDFNLTKSTQLSLNIGGDIGIKNQPSGFSWKDLYFTSGSRFPAYFPEWMLAEVPDQYYPDAVGIRLSESLGEHHGNPYTTLNSGAFNKYQSSKLFTDLILEQQLDKFVKGLSLKGKVSLSTYYNHRSLYSSYSRPRYQIYYEKIGTSSNPWFRTGEGNEYWENSPLDVNVGGLEDGYYADWYYEFSLNYNRTFGSHNFSALLLTNRQEKDLETQFPYYNAAVVGRVAYDFKHKYLLEVNLGYTGSERFAPGNRYGFFPSGAIGWVVSEEQFFKNSVPWMSKLKVRYSDGLVGSDYASSRWLYMSDYYKDSRGYILEDKAANSSAQWEEARKRDMGLEFGFLNNDLLFSIDLFDEQRSKILLTPQSTTLYVGNAFKDLNIGSLKKHGIEIEAEYHRNVNRNFNYFTKVLFGFNENRIVNKDDLPYAPEYSKEAGKPLGGQRNGVLLTESGYFTSVDDIHINLAPAAISTVNLGDYKFLDYTADGQVTILDKYPIEGYTYPPITYSLSGGMSYKNFDIDIMFQGVSGKYVEFNQGFENEFLFQDWSLHASQLDYWFPDNLDANHSTLHFSGAAPSILAWGGGGAQEGYGIMIEDRIWRNADYLRLKQVSIGYTLNTAFLKQYIGISNIRFYMTGNNLYTFTRLIEGDPERKDFSAGFYPQMTTVKFGLRFSF